MNRKAAQAARREVRKNIAKMKEELTDQMAFDRLVGKFIRRKPRFVPSFVWTFFAWIVLDLKGIDARSSRKS